MELTINGVNYTFVADFNFLRKINKRVTNSIGDNNAKQNQGLLYAIAQVMDGDVETLADILYLANEKQDPRLTMPALEAYITSDTTDIDDLFEKVFDFFEKENCTKKAYRKAKEAQEKAEEMAEKE